MVFPVTFPPGCAKPETSPARTAAWKLDLPACTAKSLRDLRVAVKLTDPSSNVDIEYADKLQVDALAKRGAAA